MTTPLVRSFDQAMPAPSAPTCARVAALDATRRAALAELLPLLYRQVRALAGPRKDLDDLVQAAAERALKAYAGFEGRSALSTWSYSIAYRTVQDHDRWFGRWRRRFAFDEETAGAIDSSVAPVQLEALLIQKRRAQCLHRALTQLPAAKRAVLVLHDLEELPIREVAEIVSTNERTVKSRLHDGRLKLAALLAADPQFARSVP